MQRRLSHPHTTLTMHSRIHIQLLPFSNVLFLPLHPLFIHHQFKSHLPLPSSAYFFASQKLSFQLQTQITIPWVFVFASFLFELYELLTVPLELTIAAVPNLAPVARWMSVVRAPMLGSAQNNVALWIGLGYLVAFLLLLLVEWIAIKRGAVLHSFILAPLRWLIYISSIISFAAWSVCFTVFTPDQLWTQAQIVRAVFSGLGFVWLIIISISKACFILVPIPRASFSSTYTTSVNFFWVALKILISGTHALLKPYYPSVYAAIMIIGFLSMTLLVWFMLPYYKKVMNWLMCGFWASMTVASVLSFVSTFTGESIVPMSVQLSLLLIVGLGGAVAMRFRTWHFEKRLIERRGGVRNNSVEMKSKSRNGATTTTTTTTPSTTTATEEMSGNDCGDGEGIEMVEFKSPEQVMWTVSRAFVSKENEGWMVKRALKLISRGKEQFPNSGLVHFAHAMLLLEPMNDASGALAHLSTAKRLGVRIDMRSVSYTHLAGDSQTVSSNRHAIHSECSDANRTNTSE